MTEQPTTPPLDLSHLHPAVRQAALKLAVRLTPAADIERMPDLEKSLMDILGVRLPLILIDPEKASAPARIRAVLDHFAPIV